MLDLRIYQAPVDGRNTVMSLFPSPSKSPTIGLSVLTPQLT